MSGGGGVVASAIAVENLSPSILKPCHFWPCSNGSTNGMAASAQAAIPASLSLGIVICIPFLG
jgi:hypothetical protein